MQGALVESVLVAYYNRQYPTYYIKGTSGEVDIAYVNKGTFWPVEVKWTNQIRTSELKQALKYEKILILTKNKSISIEGARTEYIPLFLKHGL